GEYDIWAMKMEHCLAHTYCPIWEVIQRGNGPVSVSTDTNGVIKVLPPKTVEEILAREREKKARTTLLMALPEDHLAKFHKMTDAREMREAIKSRLVAIDEQRRCRSVSTEDANQKFLRSLPSAWSQVSLIMRTKPGVDSLSFDDLYNNLRVFESDVKGSTASSSSTQNVAFVSENTSSTNDVSTAYGVSNSSGHKSQCENPSSYSFLANQSSCPQLDHEDLEQLDEFDLEEMDLKWQVAMISMRMKKFYKKTGRKLQFDAKEPVGFDKTKVDCYNCHQTMHFARECRSKGNQDSRRRDAWNTGNKDKDNGRRSGKQEESKALVTLDGEGVDWTSHSEDEQENYALMAYSSYRLRTQAKEMWEAIKSRFVDNDESKKMQKYILKQQFEGFSVSTTKVYIKGYDWFSESPDQLRNMVQASPLKMQIRSFLESLSLMLKALLPHPLTRKWPHLFSENTSNFVLMNVSTAYGISNPLLDEFDLEEMDLKWQVAIISMRMKKFYKKTGRKLQFDAKEPEERCYTENKDKDNGRRSGKQEESKALVTLDGEGVDWTSYSEDKQENYTLMAYSSSGSDTKMSARDKAGLGTSDIEDSHVNDRYAEGMHAVPPPMTGIYIPSGHDKEIDDSQFKYGPKQSKPSESDASSGDFNSCESNSSEETHESMPKPVVNEPKVVSQPKVWSDAPIIEEYESDSDDEHVFVPTKEQETPSFAFSNIVKHVKTPRQTVKEQNTCSKSPKPDKKDCSGLMSKKLGLGYGFTKKACFVCGSFSHLIRDCDFHEKRMAKQAESNNRMYKGSGQRKNRPVWNNVQRVNHQNQFVPKAVLTRTGKIQVNKARTSGTNTVNTARHNSNNQAVPTNAARKVNTVKPNVNNTRQKTGFHKTLSPFRKPFNRTTTLRTNFSNQKVNIAEVNAVSAVGGKKETAVKPSAGCNWRPKIHY
ncbi:ribonuclease H-like domain-containing protein, partial [Tanacetum coccineum]